MPSNVQPDDINDRQEEIIQEDNASVPKKTEVIDNYEPEIKQSDYVEPETKEIDQIQPEINNIVIKQPEAK